MRPHPKLVREFALRAFAVMLLLGLLLCALSGWLIARTVLSESTRAVRGSVEVVVESALAPDDFSRPLSGPELTAFDARVHQQLLGNEIVGLTIFNVDGIAIYSTDHAEIGKQVGERQDFLLALSGQTVSRVQRTAAPGESRTDFNRWGRLASSFAPLVLAGRPVGCYESHQRYAPIGDIVAKASWIAWAFIALACVAAYAGQIGILRTAEWRVELSEARLADTGRRLDASLQELESHVIGTLQALVSAVDAKDSYTASHSLGVADCARAIGRRMGLDESDLLLLEKASLLHDVGKIGVAERILLKPGPLTDEERAMVREHADLGARMVESIPFLAEVVPIIRHHHERWDGAGYPDSLAGDEIPLLARILTVADSYDAMISERPYRGPLSFFRVRQQLRRNRGTQFDPRVVAALIEAMRAGEVAMGPHEEESSTAS